MFLQPTALKHGCGWFYNNIIAIFAIDGTEIVCYNYNAWGECSSTGDADLAQLNPFRYRGYFFDSETGLYFLKTRYYDPAVGRFISQDDVSYLDPETVGGCNLYAYCGNNPVNRIDPDGTKWSWATFGAVVGIIVVAAAMIALTIVTAGAAAAGAAALAGAYLGVSTTIAGIAVTTLASAAAYAAAAVAVVGFTLFAASDISATLGGHDFMRSALGSYYSPVRDAVNLIPMVLGVLSEYAPQSYNEKENKTEYPPNKGFDGKPKRTTLQSGTRVYRYGGTRGKYIAPEGTSGEKLSLPPDKIGMNPTTYVVIKPIKVVSGPAAPWFGQPGGGTQYYLSHKIIWYILHRYMEQGE